MAQRRQRASPKIRSRSCRQTVETLRQALSRERTLRKQVFEQLTTTAEILRVIAESQTDVEPVFDFIKRAALRLFGGIQVAVLVPNGDRLDVRASTLHHAEKGVRQFVPFSRESVAGRSIIDRTVVNVIDTEAPHTEPLTRDRGRALGFRAIAAAPMLRAGHAVGSLVVALPKRGGLTEEQLALLKAFADQAAIAIENVRLFSETKEALERQKATSEILRVIAASPTDVQPVFDSIIANAVRLCDGLYGAVYRYEHGLIDLKAWHNFSPEALDTLRRRFPQPAGDASLVARSIRNGAVVYVPDIDVDASVPSGTRSTARALGYRSQLTIPMVQHGAASGAIVVATKHPNAFSAEQIKLLETFADQAVIAIENVRLFNETKAALEQQTATAEILRMISALPAHIQPVFEAILDRAVLLCDGHLGGLFLRAQDDTWSMLSYKGDDPGIQEAFQHIPAGPHTGFGKLVKIKRPVQIPDLLADSDTPKRDLLRLMTIEKLRARTFFAVPLLKEAEVIGAVVIYRQEVRPFTESQIRLVATFADQAVIAIENLRLFREIQDKSTQLELANRQLEVANKHKSDFLANMSHELRTPLNAIIGFSEAMIERMFGELNDKQLEYQKDILESGKHLLSLINDILDLSKIEAGRMELEVSNFHLPTAVSNAVILIRERAMRHGIALGVDIDQRLGEFQADERKVKQILLNLLSNAVKFTPDGGRVDVSAKLNTDKVEIAVKDTGVGIAPEDQASLFEEFKQLGKDSSHKAEGTGLGLALTKRLVELHGGEIRVDSAVGHGSTFRVILPSPTYQPSPSSTG